MGAVGLIVERIPHKDVSYAYLEIQASNANEFEALREEALKKIPNYAFALSQPSAPKTSAEPMQANAPASADAGAEGAPVAGQDESPAGAEPAASAPTSTEGLSPRELARQRVAAKKGA